MNRKPRCRHWLGLFVCLAATWVTSAPHVLMAQEPGERAPGPSQVLIDGLRQDQWIRVALPQDRILSGRFEGTTSLGLSVSLRSGGIEVPYAEIDSLWIGRPSDGHEVVVGALIGSALGIALTALAIDVSCEAVDNRCDGSTTQAWVIGTAGGAGIGAGIGALVRSGSLRWELVFP